MTSMIPGHTTVNKTGQENFLTCRLGYHLFNNVHLLNWVVWSCCSYYEPLFIAEGGLFPLTMLLLFISSCNSCIMTTSLYETWIYFLGLVTQLFSVWTSVRLSWPTNILLGMLKLPNYRLLSKPDWSTVSQAILFIPLVFPSFYSIGKSV